MFTTPQQQPWAAGDRIPNDKVDLLNCMCILVLTRGNGTLFDASSVEEEDITKMCV